MQLQSEFAELVVLVLNQGGGTFDLLNGRSIDAESVRVTQTRRYIGSYPNLASK